MEGIATPQVKNPAMHYKGGGNRHGTRKGQVGHAGFEFSEADLEVSRKRFERYIELTKGEEKVPFDSVIHLLPMEGGTPLACGETRFQHIMNDGCTESHGDARCGGALPGAGVCARARGHKRECKTRKQMNDRRARERRLKRARG